jgi:eukaryotic-like serine/threonine-protein kinase
VQFAGHGGGSLVKRRTDDLEAYNLYLQGRHHWLRDPTGYPRALACFEQAVARDPSFAAAHAGLADLHLTVAWSGAGPSGPAYAVARHHAERALALDDTLGDAHRSLGLTQMTFDWDFAAAERSLTRALALDPGSGITCVQLGLLLAQLGRFDEGVRYAQRARDLDPTTAIVRCYVAYTLALARAFRNATAEARIAIELDRNHPAAWNSCTRLLSIDGRHDEATACARDMLTTVGRESLTLGAAAFALIRAGHRDEARGLIAELTNPSQAVTVSPMVLADIAVAMGDADGACAWLEKAVADKALGVLNLGTAPSYGPLRCDPRFRALLTRVGLPELTGFPPVW